VQTSQKNGTEASGNDDDMSGESGEGGEAAEKKMSLRDKVEAKKEERRKAQEFADQTIPKIQLGASCENLMCGSCKVIVEEFGKAVQALSLDADYQTLDDVLDGIVVDWGDEDDYGDEAGGGDKASELDTRISFCKRPEIEMKYNEIVESQCKTFLNETLGYRNALLLPFEEDGVWPRVAERASLNDKTRRVCQSVGACNATTFEFSVSPQDDYQQQWEPSCFVCQRVAKDLEEQSGLLRQSLWETYLSRLINEVCDRLQFPPEYDNICREMTGSRHRTEVEWALRENVDAAMRGAREELEFADSLCRSLTLCDEFLEPEMFRIKQVTKLLKPDEIIFA